MEVKAVYKYARGSANMIRKRTSHITVILADQEG